jgi:hypothetical protein
MSLTTLALAAFLLLFAVSTLGWVAISATVLGVVALIAGILILVDGYHPVTVWRRPNTTD